MRSNKHVSSATYKEGIYFHKRVTANWVKLYPLMDVTFVKFSQRIFKMPPLGLPMMPTINSNISVDFTQTFIFLAYFGLALSFSYFEKKTMWIYIRSQTHKLKLPL